MASLTGGILIGVAVSLMLYFNGRVTGISGIIGGILNPQVPDKSWRYLFVLGLFAGGLVLRFVYPVAFEIHSSARVTDYIIGGVLVGFGTLLGNGCTSGHGICGISRFSGRSIISTFTFITFGMIGVILFKALRGEL